MQTALHIRALVSQMATELIGATVVATELYKKERTAYIVFKCANGRMAFGFCYHPSGAGCFLVPASKIQVDTREKPWPFFELESAVVRSVEQCGLDRIVRIGLHAGAVSRTIIVEALGPNGNLWLLDNHDGRLATLRRREFQPRSRYEAALPTDRLDPFRLTSRTLSDRWKEHSSTTARLLLEKHIVGFNKTLAREAASRAAIDADMMFSPDHDLSRLSETARELAERFDHAEPGYLYTLYDDIEVYPFKLRSASSEPEKFKNLSLAVFEYCRRKRSGGAIADERKTIMAAVQRALKKAEHLVAAVEQDLAKAGKYEHFKHVAELLQINFARLRRGMKAITVEDVMDDRQSDMTIALDSALSPQENVESYVKKYRKGRDGYAVLQRRLEVTRSEVERIGQLLRELDSDFDAARQKYDAEIQALLPHEPGARREPALRLPYREFTLSTGVRVFVGRDGADNDRTTFEFSKPYELWFHAQQCPGSHVVIKYPNKSFQPSKKEIEEAAAIAAYHSKARNDRLVPVVYTERRYVRKPRKAKPGLVLVEREKSIMVSPRKATGSA